MNTLQRNTIIQTAQHFGTPTFLYDAEKIAQKYITLRKILTPHCKIHYSMKANPTLGICQFLNKLGANCEVSSKIELLTALKADFKPAQIIFVGPAKTSDELQLCIENNIKFIICESLDEIYKINTIAKINNTKTAILIRINPDFCVAGAPIKMSGVASQFGIEVAQVREILKEIRTLENIAIEGIQVYNASRVLDATAIENNIKHILELAQALSCEFNAQWKWIDIGGGLGVPYFQDEMPIDSALLANAINHLLSGYHQKNPNTQFIVELGRYLVAESGYLISSVQSVKKSHEKNFIIVDAGMHCHMAATGIGSFIHRNFPFAFIAMNSDITSSDAKKCYQVVGPLCTPGDTLLREISLGDAHNGDLLVLLNTGAYGLTASPSRFLSHGSPAEVMHCNEQLHLIRRRETQHDIWSTQHDMQDIFSKPEETHYV